MMVDVSLGPDVLEGQGEMFKQDRLPPTNHSERSAEALESPETWM